MKRINVGLIGFGFIGKVHAYGYVNLPLFYDPPPVEAKLAGVCTSRPETAERAKALLGFDFCTTDFRRITENPAIDVVHICTPNACHRDELLSAIRHGKHIYCDKPLAASAEEADEIVSALSGYRGVNQMTLQNRFFPATLRAKELMSEGFVGDVLSFRACYLHAGSADPKAPLKWKLDKELAGGGVLYDLGSHVLDLVRHLVGEFDEVFCDTKIAFPDRPSAEDPSKRVRVESEDLALMMIRTRGGALGTVEATKIATGSQDELRFEIHGTKGALRFNGMEANYLEAYDATASGGPTGGRQGWQRIDTGQRYPKPAGFPGPKFTIGWIRSHMACLHNFLVGVAEGKPVQPDLREGARLQHIMDAGYESAKRRAWVKV